MHPRILMIVVGLSMVLVGGCQMRRAGPDGRPTAAQFAAALPTGTVVNEVVFANLHADGRDVALVAATVPSGGSHVPTALVFASEGRRHVQGFDRRLPGDAWLPILVGQPGDGAPRVAVFAVRAGSQAVLRYVVVRDTGRALSSILENHGVFQGSVRFVPEGLLESSGDTDRLLRWTDSGWQTEELGSQYVGQLPADTTKIEYFVDPVRGPMVDAPMREIRARVGQHLMLRRTDRGAPSRILYTGTPAVFSVGGDGVVELLQPGVFQIHIEGPAYSGRMFTIQVQVGS